MEQRPILLYTVCLEIKMSSAQLGKKNKKLLALIGL